MKKELYQILIFVLLYACANPVAPTGGDKDEDAPKIRAISPPVGSTNIKDGKIIIQFDEYFNIQQSEDKIFITPPMPEKPKYIVKGKNLIIKLPENLSDNTTYNINFMGAVKDYNESNELEFFNYVFSTGNEIDSSSISGQVKLAADNSAAEKATVCLFLPTDTGILTSTKPQYLVKTNAAGQFKIDYIKQGAYKIAVLKEENNNLLYDTDKEMVSLPTNTIDIVKNEVLEQDIYIFGKEKEYILEGYKLLNNREVIFYFTKEVEILKLNTALYNPNDYYFFNATKDTLHYFLADTAITENTFMLSLADDEKIDTVIVDYTKSKIDEAVQLLNANIPANDTIKIKFPYPILSIDTSAILLQDSLNNIKYNAVIKNNEIHFSAKLTEGNIYTVVINENAVQYFNNKTNNASQTFVVNTKEKVDKGDLILSLNYETHPNLILQLLQNSYILNSYQLDGVETINIKDLKAGKYTLKVFIDYNENLKWDTGNFEAEKEAEKVLFYTKDIEIKDNWDKELTINF